MARPFPPGVHRVHQTVVVAAMGMAAIALAYSAALYFRARDPILLWRSTAALGLLVALGLYLRWFMRRTSPLR